MFNEVWEIFGLLFVWLCRLLGSIWEMAFLEREGFLLSFSRIEAWSYRSVLGHGAVRILDSFNTIVMISWYLQMIFKRTITRFIMTSLVSFSGSGPSYPVLNKRKGILASHTIEAIFCQAGLPRLLIVLVDKWRVIYSTTREPIKISQRRSISIRPRLFHSLTLHSWFYGPNLCTNANTQHVQNGRYRNDKPRWQLQKYFLDFAGWILATSDTDRTKALTPRSKRIVLYVWRTIRY